VTVPCGGSSPSGTSAVTHVTASQIDKLWSGSTSAVLPTPERQGRFFIDVARCFDQWGKPEQCYRALLAAEHAAPQEIRRGAVKDLASGLLHHDRSLPGVHAFASRAGFPTN
jgi:hypothetical protein